MPPTVTSYEAVCADCGDLTIVTNEDSTNDPLCLSCDNRRSSPLVVHTKVTLLNKEMIRSTRLQLTASESPRIFPNPYNTKKQSVIAFRSTNRRHFAGFDADLAS